VGMWENRLTAALGELTALPQFP